MTMGKNMLVAKPAISSGIFSIFLINKREKSKRKNV
jgi:hypothetical protein